MLSKIISGPNKITSHIKPITKPRMAYPKLKSPPVKRKPLTKNPAIGIAHNRISTKTE